LNITVSAETLLQGAWYALEQSGRLLTSAALVCDHGDKSTALVLSMFGREELGRSTILRQLAKRVTEGEHLSPKYVQAACKDHPKKQASGALSTTLRTEGPNQHDAAARVRMRGDPSSEEWQQASEVIDLARDSKSKCQPNDRHKLRERALYVDLEATETTWLRPVTLDSAQCFNEIDEAINDYAGQYNLLHGEVLASEFPEMAAALANMEPKVILPKPRWPKFP
jgi:AbiV family abortive infection protein